MRSAVTVHPLQDNQLKAVAPQETVWLSASAGTGKTQVLSSRVLRLLLERGVEPSQILCLTFTKAGATEMAARINDTLARWVRANSGDLAAELKAIGADFGPEAQARARTLFAAVLDCPGGGLRVDTIHAFSQWLLAAFPHESGLVSGVRPMEDRERSLLAKQVLAELLVDAEREPLGDPQLLEAASDLSLRMGPAGVEAYLLRCAQAREAWFGPGAWQEPMRPNVMRLLRLPEDADESHIAAQCGDGEFDIAALRRCLETNRQWRTKTGQEAADAIETWLAGDEPLRSETLNDLRDVFLTKKGEPRSSKSQDKIDPAYSEHCARVVECIARVSEMRVLLALTDRLVPALRLGRAFALAWEQAKLREGWIDFDDQIRRAAALLNRSELSEWIRYKLDRRFDHILVDEAQDTNVAQWRIVFALADEFWAGLGQRGQLTRTLFVVGDYKQAIFRFQGTSPENFREAGQRVGLLMDQAATNAEVLRTDFRPRRLLKLGLDQSFRTAKPVLEFVDRAIAQIGRENFGLETASEPHVGLPRPGYVALWRPVGEVDEDAQDEEADDNARTWLSKPDRQLAERIARQVKEWIDENGAGFQLLKGGARRAGPGDIMILVRKRRELAGLIVARLHAAGVPVAGVDRLRLGAPLAVQDLIAALRFAAQPLDDLNLACLLVSPLIGWSQHDLLNHGYRDKGVRLWHHLRARTDATVVAALDQLGALLALADYEPPQALLHWLLVGPWQGRRKLVARLGDEANDPINELLNAANAYAAGATPSLVGFLNWFDAGEGELKREAGGSEGLVRVMTVHGAKGLQAPIVILADATGDPGKGPAYALDLVDRAVPERRIPLPALRKEERAGPIAEEFEKARIADEQEHWRLLYVAMTRAEEALFIGGSLGAREREPAPKSWYAKLRALFDADAWVDDPIWSTRLEWDDKPASSPPQRPGTKPSQPEPLPQWLTCNPPAEPRPPRPLAPSSLGEDEAPDPPYPPEAGQETARRGTLMHKLLERLPDIDASQRLEAGKAWLERHAGELAAVDRDAMLNSALAVIADERWAELFSSRSLAEVPIAATVGDQVVAGTIDRLMIKPDRIRLVDFKTARRPPTVVDEVPRPLLRQIAAYVAALETSYPGRSVEAALLYTSVPRLIALPADVLARHKPGLMPAQ